MNRLTNKICLYDDILERVGVLPRPLVFTNGVFDILHRGHVDYLEGAAELGRSLVVGVNSDASVKMLNKGPGRPVNKADDRAVVLAGLTSVSLVIVFDESKPLALIKKIMPDVYVKGGDYNMENLEETQLVRTWGACALAVPFRHGYSTTGLVDRIKAGW